MGAVSSRLAGIVGALRLHWADRHYRNGNYLMLNSAVGAAAGMAFWLVLVRVYALPERDIGIGGAVISLCTAFALLARGGLDVALVRHVPRATRAEGRRLLELAVTVGFGGVGVLVLLLAVAARALGLDGLGPGTFLLVGALAALLVVTWLQDAHFLAEGEARFSFYRNVVLHAGRLACPALVLALALPFPIPIAWGLAMVASILVAAWLLRILPDARGGPGGAPGGGPSGEPEGQAEAPTHAGHVPPRVFLRTAAHNVTGSAAEFLPGLLLPPLVLRLQGAEASAWFYIAWTGASMLFLLSASIARSTFAEMSRHGEHAHARYLRKALKHHQLIVLPAALLALLTAPLVLRLFGPAYLQHGLTVFLLLAASIVLIVPVYLYLALLRSRDEHRLLVAFPAVNIALLFSLAYVLEPRFGLDGIGLAWLLAHAPLALFAASRLRRATRDPVPEVTHAGSEALPAHGGPAHVE